MNGNYLDQKKPEPNPILQTRIISTSHGSCGSQLQSSLKLGLVMWKLWLTTLLECNYGGACKIQFQNQKKSLYPSNSAESSFWPQFGRNKIWGHPRMIIWIKQNDEMCHSLCPFHLPMSWVSPHLHSILVSFPPSHQPLLPLACATISSHNGLNSKEEAPNVAFLLKTFWSHSEQITQFHSLCGPKHLK